MKEYILSCESTADISAEHLASRNLSYICFHFSLDGVDHPDDLGKTIPFDQFYQLLREGHDPSTSQVNIEEYVNYFEPIAAAGKDIVHCCLSSGISGSYNSACGAAAIIRERYPDCSINVIDSLAASAGFGLLMDAAADQRDAGLSCEQLVAWIEANKLRVHHWFFSSDLTFFVKGGRISKASAMFGGLLEICPLMNVDFQGHLIPRFKIRTKKRVIKEIVSKMVENAQDGTGYSGKCYMSQADCLEDARAVASLVEASFPNLNGKVEINWIGTTIGAHTGPGTVALFFFGSERVD